MKILLSLIFLLSITACSTLPPAIKNPPARDISYSQASADITHYRGAPVRWGGVIIDVLNDESFSRLQVLTYPLNCYGRPDRNKRSQGRFYIDSTEFLDPAVYAKDKEVTVAGVLNGDQKLMIGKKMLRLPVIKASTLYLWPNYYYYDGFYPGYYYGGYYGYPYYWGSYYGYYPRY